MALHQDCVRALEMTASWGVPDEPTVEFARQSELRRHREFSGPAEPVAAVDHVAIPTGSGPVDAILYRPHGEPAGVLVHLHGGGWTIGSPELSAPQARAIANAGNCMVMSVRYRLAPEDRYPAGLEDAYAATCWAVEHCELLGAPPGSVVVAGESSGGNFAAAVCLMARDRNGPRPAGQLLIYPATARDIDTESRREFSDGYGLSLDALQFFWSHYLGPEQDASHPYVSPLLAADHAGLPPAVVVTAACDILRDDGERYAQRLRDAGVPVELRRFEGMLHGFLGYARVVRAAESAYGWIGEKLRPLFPDPVRAGDA